MAADLIDTRGIYVYARLLAIYTVAGIALFLVFLYFCFLAREDLRIASSNDLTLKIARVAYESSHGSIQFACGRYDPQLAYTLMPGACSYSDTEYEMDFHVNSAGLRDDEASLVGPEIIVVGDSHTLGVGVSENETFVSLLEDRSERKVLNAGMSSYGTARELMLLRRLDTGNADTIVIQYCRNDFPENSEYLENDGRLDIMTQDRFEAAVDLANADHRSFLSPGVGVIRRAMDKTSRVVGAVASGEREGISEAEAFKHAVEQNIDLLKGKKVIVLEINGHNRYDNMFIDPAKRELADLPIDLHFIDVREFLTDKDHFLLDNHMTAEGHRKVAEAILDTLDAN